MSRVALLATSVQRARPLADALSLRGLPAEIEHPAAVRLDLGERRPPLRVLVNLVGDDASAAERLFTAEYLAYLADVEAPVVNGLDAFVVGSSSARQLALLQHLRVPHPPARVVAEPGGTDAALAELGVAAAEADVLVGPPVVVRARVTLGAALRLDFVAGRLAAAADAAGQAVQVGDDVVRLGEQIVGTGGLEFGGVTFAEGPEGLLCLAVDTRPGTSPAALGRLAEHVAFRAGVGR